MCNRVLDELGRCILISIIFIQSLLFGSQAHAEDDRAKFPIQMTISPAGTNLQTGRYYFSHTDFEIGDLKFTREWGNQSALFQVGMRLFGITLIANKFNYGWTHSLNQGTRARSSGANTIMSVAVEGQIFSFYANTAGSYTPSPNSGEGTYLRKVGSEFRFTDRGGTEYSFMVHPATDQNGYSSTPNQLLREAVHSDGTVLSYTYLSTGRLQEVRSSRGYAIHLDYDANGNIITACGLNLAQAYAAASTPCGTALLRSSYEYEGSGDRLIRVTDTRGGVVRVNYEGTTIAPGPTCISLINSQVCAISNTYGNVDASFCLTNITNQIGRQVNAAGEEWHYCFEGSPNSVDEPYREGWPRWSFATMKEPDGFQSFFQYDRGRLVDVTGRDGNINYKYQGAVVKSSTANSQLTFEFLDALPSMITYPEGNSDYFVHNKRGKVLLLQHAPKGGQEPYMTDGAPALPSDIDLKRCCMRIGVFQTVPGSISLGQAFLPDYGLTGCGSGSADAKRCDKPIAFIDPRGSQTDYTYSDVHGGILTETGPAVNGIRPQTRYTYSPRYAWIKNSSGGYVQAGSPIYVMTQKSYCRTSSGTATGCSVAGDEVVTTFDYGPDAGPSNLLVRGEAVSADGHTVRTCYGYDWQGNKISTTSPRAGLASCI